MKRLVYAVLVALCFFGPATKSAKAEVLDFHYAGAGGNSNIAGDFVVDTSSFVAAGPYSSYFLPSSIIGVLFNGSVSEYPGPLSSFAQLIPQSPISVNLSNQLSGGEYLQLVNKDNITILISTAGMLSQGYEAQQSQVLARGTGDWSNGTVTLPTTKTAKGFTFSNFAASQGVSFIDPSVATGYNFLVNPNGPLISSVTIPYLIAGQLLTSNLDLSYGGMDYQVAPGSTYVFSQPVSNFTIMGIPESFAVDPTNDQAFVVGLAFNETGNTEIEMDPINFPPATPEPASLTMLSIAIAAIAGYAWRRRKLATT